jgi:hypothetical protein
MRRTTTALAILVTTAAAPILAQRFDMMVRGDEARLARGMEACEKRPDSPVLKPHVDGCPAGTRALRP